MFKIIAKFWDDSECDTRKWLLILHWNSPIWFSEVFTFIITQYEYISRITKLRCQNYGHFEWDTRNAHGWVAMSICIGSLSIAINSSHNYALFII